MKIGKILANLWFCFGQQLTDFQLMQQKFTGSRRSYFLISWICKRLACFGQNLADFWLLQQNFTNSRCSYFFNLQETCLLVTKVFRFFTVATHSWICKRHAWCRPNLRIGQEELLSVDLFKEEITVSFETSWRKNSRHRA